jgi:hypothetical protein
MKSDDTLRLESKDPFELQFNEANGHCLQRAYYQTNPLLRITFINCVEFCMPCQFGGFKMEVLADSPPYNKYIFTSFEKQFWVIAESVDIMYEQALHS